MVREYVADRFGLESHLDFSLLFPDDDIMTNQCLYTVSSM